MPCRRSRSALLPLVAALALPAPAAASGIADEIIVKHAPGAPAADVRADADVALVRSLPLTRVQLVAADAGERAGALRELRADPRVVWAESNRVVRAAAVSDPGWDEQWGLRNTGAPVFGVPGTPGADIGAEAAWERSLGGGVTVGVVDSGAQLDHPDLRLVPGHDYVDDDATPEDGDGHGTHVAGIVAAAANTIGVIGVAPQAQVRPLRVLGDDGYGSSADTAAAFAAAGAAGLKVVNASLGASAPTLAEQAAIAQHPGTLYVVAAGNDGEDVDQVPTYPCAYPEANILCVGASDNQDGRALFGPTSASNHGAVGVDVFAPGNDILSAYLSGQYAWMSGTSMAAPMAAGAAALLFAADPSLTAAHVKQALMASADRPGALAGTSVTGGRIDAAAALAYVDGGAPLDTTAPAVPAGLTAVAGNGRVELAWTSGGEADLARFDVYRRNPDGTWPVLPTLRTDAPAATVSGLANGRAYAFRVTAVDRVGNASAPSAVVTATPAGAAPPAPPPAVQPGPPAPAVAEPGARTRLVRGLRLSGTPRACRRGCKASAVAIRFTTTRAATVGIALERRSCRFGSCGYKRVGALRHKAAAGAQRVLLRRVVRAARLVRGGYRLRAGDASLRFTVR